MIMLFVRLWGPWTGLLPLAMLTLRELAEQVSCSNSFKCRILTGGPAGASRTKPWDQWKGDVKVGGIWLISLGVGRWLLAILGGRSPQHRVRHPLLDGVKAEVAPSYLDSRKIMWIEDWTLIKFHLSKMSFEQSFKLQVGGNAVEGEKKQPLVRQMQALQPPWPPSHGSTEGDLGRGFRLPSSSLSCHK